MIQKGSDVYGNVCCNGGNIKTWRYAAAFNADCETRYHDFYHITTLKLKFTKGVYDGLQYKEAPANE